MDKVDQTTTIYTIHDPDDELEEELSSAMRQRPLEQTSEINRWLRDHSERMQTWRQLQKEWMF